MVMVDYTLVICSNQHLVSRLHSIFNVRNKITKKKFEVLLISIFQHVRSLHGLILLQILRKFT